VIAAGPAVNFVLAFVLIVIAFWAFGPTIVTPTVDQIRPGSPAAGALHPGDKIVAVDGHKGTTGTFIRLISAHRCPGKVKRQGCQAATPAAITVRRGGRLQTLQIRPRYDVKAARPLVGFQYAETRKPYGASKAVSAGLNSFWFIARETVKLPSYIFNAHKRKQISGIVGTSNAAHQAVAADAGDAVFLFAVISLSLAIINLFPFLPLDGGHIFWAAVEFVRRRPVPYAVMERAGVLGFMLVIGLFLLGLTNDINRLTNGPGMP
ncbi:MAG: site-2 protease family protein, partial [Thermoleophilaceae bacterium]